MNVPCTKGSKKKYYFAFVGKTTDFFRSQVCSKGKQRIVKLTMEQN